MPQPLSSSRESSLFRQLIRNYDTKQYKKGRLKFIRGTYLYVISVEAMTDLT